MPSQSHAPLTWTWQMPSKLVVSWTVLWVTLFHRFYGRRLRKVFRPGVYNRQLLGSLSTVKMKLRPLNQKNTGLLMVLLRRVLRSFRLASMAWMVKSLSSTIMTMFKPFCLVSQVMTLTQIKQRKKNAVVMRHCHIQHHLSNRMLPIRLTSVHVRP